jgi:hypothetical protein
MKSAYLAVKENVSGFVRWLITGLLSMLIALPTLASLNPM